MLILGHVMVFNPTDTSCLHPVYILFFFFLYPTDTSFIFSARHQLDTWTACPPEDTRYGVILWVLRVLGQGLNKSARIFFIRAFSGCYAILTSPKTAKQLSMASLQSRSALSSFGVVLMSCRVNCHVVRSALQYSACRI